MTPRPTFRWRGCQATDDEASLAKCKRSLVVGFSASNLRYAITPSCVCVRIAKTKIQRLKPHSFCGVYVVAEATTHKHSRGATQALLPAPHLVADCAPHDFVCILYNPSGGGPSGGGDEPLAGEVGVNNGSKRRNRHGAGARAGREWNEPHSHGSEARPPGRPCG